MQGPPGLDGKTLGWTKAFNSASINGVASDVLKHHVTGTPGYMVTAKVGASFGNNAKQVNCRLLVVENDVATVVDDTETMLVGNATTTAKGVIALGGLYLATGGASSGVDVIMQCQTGGDARTLTHKKQNKNKVTSPN